MPDSEKIGLDTQGNFVKWRRVIDLEARVQQQAGTTTPIAEIPGINFSSFLQPYMNQKVKIIIDVQKES